jgi:hypothetical protein
LISIRKHGATGDAIERASRKLLFAHKKNPDDDAEVITKDDVMRNCNVTDRQASLVIDYFDVVRAAICACADVGRTKTAS